MPDYKKDMTDVEKGILKNDGECNGILVYPSMYKVLIIQAKDVDLEIGKLDEKEDVGCCHVRKIGDQGVCFSNFSTTHVSSFTVGMKLTLSGEGNPKVVLLIPKNTKYDLIVQASNCGFCIKNSYFPLKVNNVSISLYKCRGLKEQQESGIHVSGPLIGRHFGMSLKSCEPLLWSVSDVKGKVAKIIQKG